MARSLPEIYNSLIAEKQTLSSLSSLQPSIDDAQNLLADLTSTSKVSIWRLQLWLVAFGIYIHEQLWDAAKSELEEAASNVVSGTARWYSKQCLLFQYGYPLLYLNDKFQYSQIDLNAQIIKRAACVDQNGIVLLKVAKFVSNNILPLNSTELAAFQVYINQIKYAGTQTIIVSQNPDFLRLSIDLYYDPQVIDGNGMLLNGSTFPVHEAIESFISNLPFNGELHLSSLVDAIQIAQGVKDIHLNSASSKVGLGPYNAINVSYLSVAGYLKIDPSYPLTATINYIPDTSV
jgi:hypothetical protein